MRMKLSPPNTTDHQQFEQLVRHRPRWTAYAAITVILATVGALIGSTFRSDLFWCLWMLANILQFTPVSNFRFGPRTKSLLADEANIALRDRAIRAGFWGALGAVAAVILASCELSLTAAQGAEIVGGIALATTCTTHAILDRRTLTDPS